MFVRYLLAPTALLAEHHDVSSAFVHCQSGPDMIVITLAGKADHPALHAVLVHGCFALSPPVCPYSSSVVNSYDFTMVSDHYT